MKRLTPLAFAALTVSLVACSTTPPPSATIHPAATSTADATGRLNAQAARPKAVQRYVVVFKAQTVPPNARQLVAAAGGRVTSVAAPLGVITVEGSPAVAAQLAGNAAVDSVGTEHLHSLIEPARRQEAAALQPMAIGAPTAADDLYGYQWDMRRIGAPAAWARVPLETQAKVTVAVLDTGVLDSHPDLASRVSYRRDTSYCGSDMGTGNPAHPGYDRLIDLDLYPAWMPGADPCTPAAPSYNTHGTHVAGTVAASFGGGRVVGVAPGAKIAAYKVFDRLRYTDASGQLVDDVGAFDGPIFEAIADAADRGFQVINMSLGSTIDRRVQADNASWKAWNRAVNYAVKRGTVVVVAAGNDATNSNGSLAHIPGDLPGAIEVSATGTARLTLEQGLLSAAPGSDVPAFYTNMGASVDLSAPGGDCGPTFPNGCEAPYLILNAGVGEDPGPSFGQPVYYFLAGTSMAAPHVAGGAALVMALNPQWNSSQVKSWLQRTAEPLKNRQIFGHGLLNVDAATRTR